MLLGQVTTHPIIGAIGNTPLLPLRKIRPQNQDVSIYAKAEFLNPGGSVKDRAASCMVMEALEQGMFSGGRRLLDATSGNTGIAYAMLGAALDIPVTLCVPKNASRERLQLLRAYGAELILTDPLEGTDGAIEVARELYRSDPDRYHYIDQYSNEANWRAHYETTAPEIIQQTRGALTHFVAGLGTSGTFTGTSLRLKELVPEVKCVSFQPDSPFHGLEGLKHMETAMKPQIYREDLADIELRVSTKEAYEMTRRLAREEGYLVGISSGAALVASLQLAERIDRGTIVTIFPDRGERYLSENIWKEVNS